jgi:hypothetical protein
MTGSTFNPVRISDFDKTKLTFDAQGAMMTVSAGQTTNVDLTLTDDCLITGAWLVSDSNTAFGDYACLQVVDTTGITGYPAGTVLSQFVTNWYVIPNMDEQFDVPYPAKIIAGLTLRLVYISTGTNNAFIAVNYKLHKVLV